MSRFRFTLEFEAEDSQAGSVRDAAMEAAEEKTDGVVRGHVVHEVREGDDWEVLPLLEK